MTSQNLAYRATLTLADEAERLSLQVRLDSGRTQAERNRFGQFATPSLLAMDIINHALATIGNVSAIRFLDPAFGTGSFYAALLRVTSSPQIQSAKGFEIDPYYGQPSQDFWKDTPLSLGIEDFTRVGSPQRESDKCNLLICNPPYVRHHHIDSSEKKRLQELAFTASGTRINGLAGLYCYFMALSHPWMADGAIAGWLVPSEFMNVNYGDAIKRYLMDKVTLVRIHRFDPNDVQFDDALVSSAVVWIKNEPAPPDHMVQFSFGGSHAVPRTSKLISVEELRQESKWTRFPNELPRKNGACYHLSDLFEVKRGLATGDNRFFILPKQEIERRDLPISVFRPILPSPRYVSENEIQADQDGNPKLERRLFLLDCRIDEAGVRSLYPELWQYLESGKASVAGRYLCRTRKLWYHQEVRSPAPILCTYIGRTDTASGRPFRFILNHSNAIAANVYLMLYPKSWLKSINSIGDDLMKRIWTLLNGLSTSSLVGEGRVYGGGLHKLEPKELGNVDVTVLVEGIPELRKAIGARRQFGLFEEFEKRA